MVTVLKKLIIRTNSNMDHITKTSSLKRLCLFLAGAALFFFATNSLEAQKYSNEFLTIPVGAKAQALGGSAVATINDVYATFLNPAGLAGIDPEYSLQLGAMHAEWFAGIGSYDYIGGVLPAYGGNKRIGLSMLRFGIDGIPNTLSFYNDDGTFNYDNITEFSAADYAFLISYAQPLKVKKGRLYLGGNFKVIHRRIGPFATSWGFGLDAGLQYHPNDQWHFGVLLKDVTSTFNAWSFTLTEDEEETLQLTGNELPINSLEITRPQIILGGAWDKSWEKVGLLAELNAIVSTDGQRNVLVSGDPLSISPTLGLQMSYGEFLFLRFGLNNLQQDRDFDREYWTAQPNLGLGFKLFNFFVDYAFTDIGDQSNQTYSHVVSLGYSFRSK